MNLAETDMYNEFISKVVDEFVGHWDLINVIKDPDLIEDIKSAMFECACHLISDSASDANLQMFGLAYTAKYKYDISKSKMILS